MIGKILRRLSAKNSNSAAAKLRPPSLPESLQAIDAFRSGVGERSADQPIFILSAGWRSGSTLLQRLVISSGQAMIWGEPYGGATVIDSMCEILRRVPRRLEADDVIELDKPPDMQHLVSSFICNMVPATECLYRSHLAFFDTWLAEPTRRLGFSRWGLKEVRLDGDHALYLRWLYPHAKFVFLYRNPYDAFRSYKGFDDTWFKKWPDIPITGAEEFGRHWNSLMTGFVEFSQQYGGILIRYEDLIKDPRVLDQLNEFLELKIDATVLDKHAGGAPRRYEPAPSELQALYEAVSPRGEMLGYAMPK